MATNKALTTRKSGGDFLEKIEAQRLDRVDHKAVDQAAGFTGKGKDAPVDTRAEDNLLRAVKAYAKVSKSKKREKPQSIEDLLAQGYHLRQRLVDLTKKICMYKMQAVFFKLDDQAEPVLAKVLEALVQPAVLRKAFELHKREAPAVIPQVQVKFIGIAAPVDAGISFVALEAPAQQS